MTQGLVKVGVWVLPQSWLVKKGQQFAIVLEVLGLNVIECGYLLRNP